VTAQSTWKKSHAIMVEAWVRRNCRQEELPPWKREVIILVVLGFAPVVQL
jgi:hypothetical protein